jgi:hypothetical protein
VKNMKIHIALQFTSISQVLELILEAHGHTMTGVDEAELVIAEDPTTLLRALKADKQVVQFVAWPDTAQAATGLATAPEYAGRVRIFAPGKRGPNFNLDWLDQFVDFLGSLNSDPAPKEA